MPNYQYYCKKCEKEFEVHHSIKEDFRTKCSQVKEEAKCEDEGEIAVKVGAPIHRWTNKRWTGKE